MNAGVKTAGKALEILKPFPFLPVSELTREAVKSYVDAQKALMDVMVRPPNGAKTPKADRHVRRPVKKAKAERPWPDRDEAIFLKPARR